MQNHYSLLYREEEREMFPTLKVSIFLVTPAMQTVTLTRNPLLDVRRRLDPLVAARPWPPDAYFSRRNHSWQDRPVLYHVGHALLGRTHDEVCTS